MDDSDVLLSTARPKDHKDNDSALNERAGRVTCKVGGDARGGKRLPSCVWLLRANNVVIALRCFHLHTGAHELTKTQLMPFKLICAVGRTAAHWVTRFHVGLVFSQPPHR